MKITVSINHANSVISHTVEIDGNSVPNFANATQAAMDRVGGIGVALQWLSIPADPQLITENVPNNHIDIIEGEVDDSSTN
jgi:hypothetical protein